MRQFNEEGLAQPKGVLKGEGKFDVKEIESVKIMFKEGKFSLVGTTALYRSLCVIFGINCDVFVREVACPDSIRTIPQPKFQANIDIRIFHECTQFIEVRLCRHTLRKDQDIVNIEIGR